MKKMLKDKMNKQESKYFNTARRMDDALISILQRKDFEYITVREICVEAGVNRSTFYLHYDNTVDLLTEATAYINEEFQKSFAIKSFNIEGRSTDELYLITDEWLVPYLNFIKENRRIFSVIHKRTSLFNVDKTYNFFFANVFSPILKKFGVDEGKHEYIMTYYRHGLIAIILKWIDGNCLDPVEKIVEILKECIRTPNNECK